MCMNTDMQSCQEMCTANKSQSFCGLCENGQDCVEASEINSGTACYDSTACVLPNETVALNLTDEECASFGKCSHPCPPKCESAKVYRSFSVTELTEFIVQ
jgi:hypothetical protein